MISEQTKLEMEAGRAALAKRRGIVEPAEEQSAPEPKTPKKPAKKAAKEAVKEVDEEFGADDLDDLLDE